VLYLGNCWRCVCSVDIEGENGYMYMNKTKRFRERTLGMDGKESVGYIAIQLI
jgi:hypothetical protein